MRRLRPLAALFTAAAVFPLGAQVPTPLAKTVEITITNVDAVATDSKGKPVTDLTRDDFELKQDGVPQAITNFSLIQAGAPATASEAAAPGAAAAPNPAVPVPAAPAIHLVAFIDELHLTASDRNRALRSFAEYLPKTLGPNVDIQIVTWNRTLRIRGEFTRDASDVAAVLESLETGTAAGDTVLRERDSLLREINDAFNADARSRAILIRNAITHCRAWCDAQVALLDATLVAARTSIAQLSGLEGRKVMFFLTQRLAPSPGRELWDTIVPRLQQMSGRGGGMNPDANDFTWKSFDRSPSFNDLALGANAARVSLVTIEGSGLTSDASFSAEFGGSQRFDEGMATLDAESALRLLAEQTGGAAVIGQNNLGPALERLEPAWTSYYSLGFESPRPKPGEPHRIRVTVKRPGVVVRSRRMIVERTTQEKVSDAVLSRIHFPKIDNPLRATLHVGTPAKSGKLFLLPLEFKIPFEKLTLIPGGGRARGRVLFTAAAAGADGRISDISTERAPVDVPDTDLASLGGKVFTYTTTLRVRPGQQTLSLALTDETSLLSSYVQTNVLIPDLERKPR